MGAGDGIDGVAQATAKTDGNQQILGAKQIYFLLQVPGGTSGSFGIMANRNQGIGEQTGERKGKINANHHNPARAMDALRKGDYLISMKA